MTHDAWLCWSSGKDSAWSLHVLRQRPDIRVTGLLTTVNAADRRVAMHGVRLGLVERQAAAAGLPLHVAEIPQPCSNAEYEAIMGRATAAARAAGVTLMAFGDLFLEDIRAYRESRLAGSGLTAVFPLWALPTAALADEMIAGGLRARLTSVDLSQLPRTFAGREFDRALIEALPREADPCGERGEFHSFAWDGPMFRAPIPVRTGEVAERGGFVYTDLEPEET
jgi:uncharacterized protein (TIGR00290 family)